jgi:putative tricarboxylic transport membrane protein
MASLMSEKAVDPDKLNYILLAGGGEGKAAILGNQISAYISGYGELADLIKAGKVRALGISASTRNADIPVATLREQGTDVVVYNWRGVFGAPGITPAQRNDLIKMVKPRSSRCWKAKAEKMDGWTCCKAATASRPSQRRHQAHRSHRQKLKLGN